MSLAQLPPVTSRLRRGDLAGSIDASRRPPPLPVLADPARPTVDTAYVVSGMDHSGRIADRSSIRALDWTPDTRLDIHAHGRTVIIRHTGDGAHRLSGQGFVKLPLTIRRWCAIAPGDRVLLAADPGGDLLMVHPLGVLHDLLAEVRAAALREGSA